MRGREDEGLGGCVRVAGWEGERVRDEGSISPKSGVCFPANVCIVVYCPLFGLYCVVPLFHFVCPCIVHVFNVFCRF